MIKDLAMDTLLFSLTCSSNFMVSLISLLVLGWEYQTAML
jgi:hypothetical protein